MSFSNKSILVTGGAGFIGSHLVDSLLKNNAEKITIIDDFSGGSQNNISHLKDNDKVTIVNGSISDKKLVSSLVSRSDFVFSLAASKLVVSLKTPRVDVETNVVGVYNILEAAMDSDVRIVHASTGSVYGSSDVPMAEDHPMNPTTIYGISKLAAEQYCMYFVKENGLKASVIRYFHVFGPRQDYSGEAGVVSIFLSRVIQNKPPIVFSGGKQIRCFTYVSDDVDATMLLATSSNAVGQAYNVASKTRISINDLALQIIDRYGSKDLAPEPGDDRVGENFRPIPDTSKIESLGFNSKVSFEEGLDLTKEWVENDVKK